MASDTHRNAARALAAGFGVFGLLSGMTVYSGLNQHRLDLSNFELALALAAMPSGALAGLWLDRHMHLHRLALFLYALSVPLQLFAWDHTVLAAAYFVQGALSRPAIAFLYRSAASVQIARPESDRGSLLLRIESVCGLCTAVAALILCTAEQSGFAVRSFGLAFSAMAGLAGLWSSLQLHVSAQPSAQAVPAFRMTRLSAAILAVYAAEIAVTGYAGSWTNVFARNALGAGAGMWERVLAIAGPQACFWFAVAAIRGGLTVARGVEWRRVILASACCAGVAGVCLPLIPAGSPWSLAAAAAMGAGTALWVPFALYVASAARRAGLGDAMGGLALSGSLVGFANHMLLGSAPVSVRIGWLAVCCLTVAVNAGTAVEKGK